MRAYGLVTAIFGVSCSAVTAFLLVAIYLAATGQWRHIFPFSEFAG